MRSYLPAVALLLILVGIFWSIQSWYEHQMMHHPAATKVLPVKGQVVCPSPILHFLDPVTGKEVTNINFGTVLVGQQKIVQVTVLNPAASPCNLQVIQLADGSVGIKEIPR